MPFTEENLLLEPGFEAIREREEAQLLRVIDELGELGVSFSSRFPESSPERAISCIKVLGVAAAEGGLIPGVLGAAASLGIIGQEAAKNGDCESVLETSLALKNLGEKMADREKPFPLRLVANSLKEVGKEAARQGMEKEAISTQFFLQDLHAFCKTSEEDFEAFNEYFSSLIRDVGKCAAEAGLEKAVMIAKVLLEDFHLDPERELFRKKIRLKESRVCEKTLLKGSGYLPACPFCSYGWYGKCPCKTSHESLRSGAACEGLKKD